MIFCKILTFIIFFLQKMAQKLFCKFLLIFLQLIKRCVYLYCCNEATTKSKKIMTPAINFLKKKGISTNCVEINLREIEEGSRPPFVEGQTPPEEFIVDKGGYYSFHATWEEACDASWVWGEEKPILVGRWVQKRGYTYSTKEDATHSVLADMGANCFRSKHVQPLKSYKLVILPFQKWNEMDDWACSYYFGLNGRVYLVREVAGKNVEASIDEAGGKVSSVSIKVDGRCFDGGEIDFESALELHEALKTEDESTIASMLGK